MVPRAQDLYALTRGLGLWQQFGAGSGGPGAPSGKGYHQVHNWGDVVNAWERVVRRAIYNGDRPSLNALANELGMTKATLYRNYLGPVQRRAELRAQAQQLRRQIIDPN